MQLKNKLLFFKRFLSKSGDPNINGATNVWGYYEKLNEDINEILTPMFILHLNLYVMVKSIRVM